MEVDKFTLCLQGKLAGWIPREEVMPQLVTKGCLSASRIRASSRKLVFLKKDSDLQLIE